MEFSRFLSKTIFIPAENTQHSEKPGQNSGTYVQRLWSIAPAVTKCALLTDDGGGPTMDAA
jgi:hypothetical protein